MPVKNCLDCNVLYEYKTNKPRCDNCKQKRRKNYLFKYVRLSNVKQKNKLLQRKNKRLTYICLMCKGEYVYKTCPPKHCSDCKTIYRQNKSKERPKKEITPELRERKRNYQQEYRRTRKHKQRAYMAVYRKTYKYKIARLKYKTTSKYKDKLRRRRLRRREYKNNIIHAFTQDQWNELLKQTKGVCDMCKVMVGIEKLTLDHIHPVSKASKGQVYTIDDVQPLCNSCNSRKNNNITKDGLDAA